MSDEPRPGPRDPDFRVDPAMIDARIASREELAQEEDRIAEALEEHADEHRRKAVELRRQNEGLLKTARMYGYPE